MKQYKNQLILIFLIPLLIYLIVPTILNKKIINKTEIRSPKNIPRNAPIMKKYTYYYMYIKILIKSYSPV